MHASCTCGVVVDVRVLVLRLVGRFTSYVSQRSCRRAVKRSARPHIDVLAVHTAGRTHRGRIMHLRVSCMMRAHMRCSEQCSSASGSRTRPPTPATPSAQSVPRPRAVAATGAGCSSAPRTALPSTITALARENSRRAPGCSRGAATGMARRVHLPRGAKQALPRDSATCRSQALSPPPRFVSGACAVHGAFCASTAGAPRIVAPTVPMAPSDADLPRAVPNKLFCSTRGLCREPTGRSRDAETCPT